MAGYNYRRPPQSVYSNCSLRACDLDLCLICVELSIGDSRCVVIP